MAPGPIYPNNPYQGPYARPGGSYSGGYAQQLVDIPQNYGGSFSGLGGQAASAALGGQGSAMDDLFRKLMGQMGGGGGYSMPSQASLEQQARNATSLQFDPQIAALKRAMSKAKSNAAYSKVAIGKLFTGLAESYKEDKKNTKQIFKEAKESEKARASDYTNQVKENYKTSMDSMAEMYKKLGIEAAAGESTVGALAKDEASNLQTAAKDTAVEQQALGQQETGDMTYWEKGMGTAKMEGTQRQGDLQQLLNDYLTENQGKLEDLRAQQKIAYEQALAQMQQEVQKQAAAQSNQSWNQMMQMGRFQMEVGRYNQQMGQVKPFGNGLTGANQYLTQQFAQSQWGLPEAERYSSILQGMILKLPQGISPEQAAAYASDEANRMGISPSVMARAMLAYYGRA